MSFLKTETTSRHPGGRRHARRGAGAPREVRGSDRWRSRRRVYPRRDHHRQAASAALDAPSPRSTMEELRVTGRDGVQLAVRMSSGPGDRSPRSSSSTGWPRTPGCGTASSPSWPVGATRWPPSTCAGTVAATSPTAGTTWRRWPTTSPWSSTRSGGPARRSSASPGVATSSWSWSTAIPTWRASSSASTVAPSTCVPLPLLGGLRPPPGAAAAGRDPAGRARAPPARGAPGLAGPEHRRGAGQLPRARRRHRRAVADARPPPPGAAGALGARPVRPLPRRSPRPCSCSRPTTATPRRRPRRRPRWRGPWRRLPAGRVHWFRPADHDVHAQHPVEVAAVLHDAASVLG